MVQYWEPDPSDKAELTVLMRAIVAIIVVATIAAAGGVSLAGETRVLVVYSIDPSTGAGENWGLPSFLNLLGHFDCEVTSLAAGDYREGEIESQDVFVYLGLGAGLDLPEALVADIYDTDKTVCWIGSDLEQLVARFSLGRYGFRLHPPRPDARYARVLYQAHALRRRALPLARLEVLQPNVCSILARAVSREDEIPYAVRSGRLWYFPEIPLLEIDEEGVYLLLCDQLHEILGQPHPEARTALLCITGVTSESDPFALEALTRYLRSQRLPFAISVVPVFRDPANKADVPLSARRTVVGVLRGAQQAGAAIVAHGLTHQRSGRSGYEAEFWDVHRDRPLDSWTPADTRRAVQTSVGELVHCGLFPLAWATPAGRASENDYREIARSFSTVWERRLASDGAPAPQVFPFLIERDTYGQRVIPDNLPLLRGEGTEVETVLEQARAQQIVPDSWVTAAIAPGAPVESVRLLIAGLREMGCRFADLRQISSWTKVDSLQIHCDDAGPHLGDLIRPGWEATIIGPAPGDEKILEGPTSSDRDRLTLPPGAILLSYPAGRRPRGIFALTGGPQEAAHRMVAAIARVVLIFGVTVACLFVVVYLVQTVIQRRA